jgi:hypothetical protein
VTRRYAAATQRNREPILDVLRRVLPAAGRVLEIASGTGEHAVFFAASLPHLTWQPSDVDAANRASIAAWREEAQLPNLLAPLDLDATSDEWAIDGAAAVVNINMIHIAPWAACEGLMRGAARVLGDGGVLYLYGPYMRDGQHTAPSNEAFDRALRAQNQAWGVRDMVDVRRVAEANGLRWNEPVPMPGNNFSLSFTR